MVSINCCLLFFLFWSLFRCIDLSSSLACSSSCFQCERLASSSCAFVASVEVQLFLPNQYGSFGHRYCLRHHGMYFSCCWEFFSSKHALLTHKPRTTSIHAAASCQALLASFRRDTTQERLPRAKKTRCRDPSRLRCFEGSRMEYGTI